MGSSTRRAMADEAGASTTSAYNLLAALIALLCGMQLVAISGAAAPPPQADCSVSFNDLMPCIEFVNSNSSGPPSGACCTAFSSTQQQHPECLCQLQQAFADPASAPGNATRAMAIPALCNVVVDYHRCSALLGLAPAPAPTPTSRTTPSVATPTPASTPRHAPAMSPPAAAPGPVPPKGSDYDCNNALNELSLCLGYVSGDGKEGPPAECCTAIGSVQAKEPVCLCQLLTYVNDSAQYGVNATLAESLPLLCHVPADTNRCPALLNSPIGMSGPAPSPAFSPVHQGPVKGPVSSPVPTPAHSHAPAAAPPVMAPVSGAPEASVDCSNEFALLQSCFAYVMANDTAPPPADCCGALGTVVANKPVCLCQLLETVGSGDPAVSGINATRALGLATVCKVNADVGKCPALLGQPASSPVPASTSPGGSPASPTGDADDSGSAAGGSDPTAAPSNSHGAPSVSRPMAALQVTVQFSTALVLGFVAFDMFAWC